MRRCDDSSLRPGRRLALGLAALALVASTLTGPAGAAVVEVGPVAPGWGVRIASRTNVSTTVLDQVVLPDGGVLALVSCNGGIGIVGGGRWVGVDEAPDQDGLAVVRIEPDGTLSWATLAISGLIGNARGYSALVRTADGRVRALTNTQGTVHGPTPTDVAGLAVAEIDPTTGEVLGGGAVAVRSTGPVFAAAAGDDVVVSTSFVGSVDVGLAPPRTTVTTEATGLARLSSNQLVTRLDPSLSPRWATHVGSTGSRGRAEPGPVATDAGGAVHVTGVHEGTVAVAGGPVLTTPVRSQRSHWATLDVDGAPVAAVGMDEDITITRVAVVAASDDVVLGGVATGTVTWGSGATAISRTVPPGRGAGWIGRFGADHEPTWLHDLQSSDTPSPSPLAPDGDGDGDGWLTTVDSRSAVVVDGSSDLPAGSHVLRFASDGTWAAEGTLPTGAWAGGVGRAADGSLVIAGTVRGDGAAAVRFGDRPGAPVVAGVPRAAFVVGGHLPAVGTATLAGTVTRSGAPVPGAVVTVVSGPPGLRPVASAATAADGRWSIDGLPGGGYRVRVVASASSRAGRWFPASPDAGGAGVVTAAPGATTTADVALPPEQVELRTIVTIDGSPARGAVVQVFTASGYVGAAPARQRPGTDTATVAVVSGMPAGDYVVRVVDPVSGRSLWHAGTTVRAAATVLPLADGSTTIAVDLPAPS